MAPRKFEFNLTPQQRKNVRRWVKELESGEYRQAKKQLARRLSPTEKGYCCLGVANKIFNMGQIDYSGGICFRDFKSLTQGYTISGPGFENLGLTWEFQIYLQNLNDKGKKPFSYIANRIRKHMLGETVPNVR